MVTRVAHEELDFVGEKGRLRSQHGVYCFALRHVDRVLERNGVKPECGGHSPQFGLIAKSLNIDPGDVVRFHQAGQCCNVFNIDGLNVVGRVLRNADTWLG